jgi:alpha-tubulin suppressor-like RCC1 family protein
MRSTRRLLDRYSPIAIVLLSCAAGPIAFTGCSDAEPVEQVNDGGAPADLADASGETSTPPGDAAPAETSTPDAAPLSLEPLPVECTSPKCAVALVTARDESFCALLNDGTVACWGANKDGQLGRGETSAGSASAARVAGLTNVVTLGRTCAVDGSGDAWCWGTGPFLQGSNVTTEPTPVKLDLPPVEKVSAYERTACAVAADGGVLCWGSNQWGQVAPGKAFAATPLHAPEASSVAAGAPIRDVAVNEATFVVREDGTVESWGSNVLLARASSLSPDANPLTTSLGKVTSIDVVENHGCAAANGKAYCWGADVGPDPRPVTTPEPIVQIATTNTVYDGPSVAKPSRWCAAAATGEVFCLGDNASGQAGDGTTNFAYRPVEVVGLPDRASQVRTTNDATCVLLTTGDVYCFGNNYYGQLGNGVMRRSSIVPVKVALP